MTFTQDQTERIDHVIKSLLKQNFKLTHNEAQDITNLVCDKLKIPPITVIYKNSTKVEPITLHPWLPIPVGVETILGVASRSSRKIILYKNGQEIGVLFHEIAHLSAKSGHNTNWAREFYHLVSWWNKFIESHPANNLIKEVQ
jgi:hypothetical protein